MATTYVGAGVHDGLSALLAEKHGFDFLWLGSFSGSAALGVPDNALRDPSEIAALVRAVSALTSRPIVVDLEWGYGDPQKVEHVVRQMMRAGASGICIEDSTLAKRSSLYDVSDRQLATCEEHEARLSAALRAMPQSVNRDCRMIARTEALVAGLGVEEAVARAERYVACGADTVFVQSTDASGAELLEFLWRWRRRTPVMLAPTCVSEITMASLCRAGASHVIFANHALRAAYRAMDETLRALARTREQRAVAAQVADIAEIAALTGTGFNTVNETVRALRPVSRP